MRILIALFFSIGLISAVHAQEGDIRDVISAQVEAFQADDFETAFTYASPGIQGVFGTPERFGQMVRNGYPMVWRPEELRFLELREIAGRLWQRVLVRDGDGGVHLLDYQMVKDENGWKINAVQVLRANEQSV